MATLQTENRTGARLLTYWGQCNEPVDAVMPDPVAIKLRQPANNELRSQSLETS